MRNQALLSSTDKSKKLKCRLLQFLCGALRVIIMFMPYPNHKKIHLQQTIVIISCITRSWHCSLSAPNLTRKPVKRS